MPFLAAAALTVLFGCVVAGLDRDVGRGMSAAAHGLFAIAVILVPRTRKAIIDTLRRFSIPVALFGALLLQAAVMSGAFFVGESANPFRAEQALVSLTGFGFLFAAIAAASTAVGRNRMIGALCIVPIVLALLNILDRFDGRADFFGLAPMAPANRLAAPFANPNEAAAAFALMTLFCAFGCVDAVTRRPRTDPLVPATLTRDLLLPSAGFIAGFNMLLLTGVRAGIASCVAGLAVFFFLAWQRGLRGRAGPRIVPFAAGGVALVSLIVLLTSGGGLLERFTAGPDYRAAIAGAAKAAGEAWREKPVFGHGLGVYELLPASVGGPPADLLRWLAEAGLFGTGLLVGAIVALLVLLWRAKDHGRQPTRGAALGLGLCVIAGLHGAIAPVLAAPAVSALLAACLGVAAAYVDPLAMPGARTAPSGRTKVLG